MKFIVRISLLILICLSIVPAYAQKRGGKANAKAAPASPHSFCQGDTIPNGFVVVEAKRTSKCVELTVKKPAATETVCDGSPVPEGYSVVRQSSSQRCYDASANPLTNAMVISNGEEAATPPQKASAQQSNDEDEEDRPIRITVGGNEQSERPKSVLERRAEEAQRKAREENLSNGPSQDEIDTAARRQTVIVGMHPQDVTRAWGASHTNDNLYENGLQVTIWSYRRGTVYFQNGVVYRVTLLKG
jgi:hypothetical protein